MYALIALLACAKEADAFLEGWNEIKSRHFVIYYQPKSDRSFARRVLHKAEEYYKTIGSNIGYTRFQNFWTWEERVKIVLFPTQKSFTETTGMPSWATGYADRHKQLFETKSIVTYRQERDFYDGLLPHEISHLMLYDFIASKNEVPIWFDEGIAQLLEGDRVTLAEEYMKTLVKQRNFYVPLKALMTWDIRDETDPLKVKVFYAQSVSIIHFLMRTYGRYSFSRLCRNLRDGRGFEDSLRNAYTNKINSIEELEDKWIRYMKR